MGLILSIITLTCPRCRKGKLFDQPFSYANALSMPYHCPHCDQKFYPEPGFYYGALFVSYGVSVWLFFFLGITLTLGMGLEFNLTVGIILVVAVLTYVYIYRLARSIWIHMFVVYDKNYQNHKI